MNPESNHLARLLAQHGHELAQELGDALARSSSPSFGRLDRDELRGRAERLVKALHESVTRAPMAVVSYIAGIRPDRIAAGYRLGEMQLALNHLERSCWQLLMTHAPVEALATELGRLTEAVGAAKDHLARRYVQALEEGGARADRRRLLSSELFQATADSVEPFERP